MKLFSIVTVLVSFFLLTSCSKNDPVPLESVESEIFDNLAAPSSGSSFIKFSFAKGSIVTDDSWDIAFFGTTILVNGGTAFTEEEPPRTGDAATYIASGGFPDITAVDESLLKQDSETGLAIPTGSGTGWYNYAGPPTHLITPVSGKVIVIKTNDGRYAKMEILSYYKDGPAAPDAFTDEAGYYTFRYVYQPNEGVTTFN